jgi:putative phosphoesterase
MKIGVISDTHGNVPMMTQAADFLVDELGAELLVHLGDDYQDSRVLEWSGRNVAAVPGLWCSEYRSATVPNRLVLDFDGLRAVAAHAQKDFRPADLDAHILLSGHTHEARLAQTDGRLHFNPGHLKALRDRGELPSFGFLDVSRDAVRAVIHEFDGSVRVELEIPRAYRA